MRYLFLFAAIITCFLSIYYFYSNDNLPVVTLIPNNEPTKIKSRAQLSQSISNEDNLIYEALSGSKNKKTLRLNKKLANDEAPLNLKENENNDDIFENIFYVEESGSNFTEQNFHDIDDSLQLIKIEEKNNNLHLLKTKKDKLFFAELDCYKTQTDADKAWLVIKQKHFKFLKPVKMFVKFIKLSEDKYYYLLLIGPYDSFSKANALCKKLTANGQNCLVHPNL